jgi:hypothetical protein
MVRHDLNPAPVGELLHDEDTAVPAEAETETREGRFREQMQISERLNEYYVQVVAEIRASLERIEAEGG